MNPSGFTRSIARGISGNQQVGYGYGSATGNKEHALLWGGSAASCVDLNPGGFTYSYAWGISGNQQVGAGNGSATGNREHALLWSGSADSFIDLHQFLPTGFVGSYAYGIDSYGNIAGRANDSLGVDHAIVWIVPEPATVMLLAVGGVLLRKRAKGKR
ncbi:MAG: PEP-CTERM sorting domain-containing protein [Planctomycetales bacterium]|nr:PEP-CTERM sorting domain-containing protein [Planctomycetales bacterium]